MTDPQIISGIKTNNPLIWSYICRNLKSPFIATLKRFAPLACLSVDDWEDIFQESCVTLMENIKNDKFEERPGSNLFSYFVEIGKRTMHSDVRKKTRHHPKPKEEEETPHIIQLWPGKPKPKEEDGEVMELSTEEKQTQQNNFLDRVFDSIPDGCKQLLKKFYWDHKPMDEIASILHLGNANSAKTKKNRCMNQFKDIAKKLVDSDEFAEEAVRACVERAMLRELLEDERMVMQEAGIKIAAFEVDDEDKPEDN